MPLHSCTLTDIDRYELATILAGLRLLQQTPALPPEIEEIATDCHEFTPLNSAQIEDLCERVNAAAEYPWRDVTGDDAETAAMEARVADLFETIEDVAEIERAGEAHDRQMRDRAQIVLEAAANPKGLPKWCAFQYRDGGVCAYRDHDLRAVELCRRDFDVAGERAIYTVYPSTDEVLDCFCTEADDAA